MADLEPRSDTGLGPRDSQTKTHAFSNRCSLDRFCLSINEPRARVGVELNTGQSLDNSARA